MQLYSNQTLIRVIKSQADKNNPYGIYNREAMFKAMQTLTPNGFKLWCYLGQNINEHEFGLSSLDVMPKCKMGRSTYYAVVNELVEKGYLIEVELSEKKRGFLFVEEGS